VVQLENKSYLSCNDVRYKTDYNIQHADDFRSMQHR
jgi:hypothetical protein